MSRTIQKYYLERAVKTIKVYRYLISNGTKHREAADQTAKAIKSEGYEISSSVVNQIMFNKKYGFFQEARDFIKNEAASTNQTKFTGSINHPTKEVA